MIAAIPREEKLIHGNVNRKDHETWDTIGHFGIRKVNSNGL